MADHPAAGAPALSTNIESGKFDEKAAHPVPEKRPVEEEEEDEDIDALIDDLESNDGHAVSLFPHFVVAPNWLSIRERFEAVFITHNSC
jgi:hypothetical protein